MPVAKQLEHKTTSATTKEPLWMNLYLIILCAPENHTHCIFIEFEIPVTSHYQSKSCLRIYIYRDMTYMGLQICVSTHGDLRLKMSKQVRSIWKISIHLNSLFIFLSTHENNDYSITFSTNLHQILQVFQASHWGLAQMSLKGTPSIRSMVSTRDWASGDHPKDDVWTRKMFFHVWN